MDENEKIIRANIPSLLLVGQVKAKTEAIGGEWKVHEINYIHPMPRNIEFRVILWNGEKCVSVGAKIHRDSTRFSNIEVQEI